MDRNRDSFDRIDDDLYELILSYLPIVDKMKYQSVCKRFERFIFNKQHVLELNASKRNALKRILFIPNDFEITEIRLERLLKKFPFITTIAINSYLENLSNVVNIIADNCRHLIEFYVMNNNLKTVAVVLCKRFGHQMERLSLNGSRKNLAKRLFRWSPNLSSISDIWIGKLDNQYLPKRLHKIQNLFLRNCDQNKWHLFSDQRLKYLRYLSIIFTKYSKPKTNWFEDIPQIKFRWLRVLKFGILGYDFEFNISKSIETIAKNCHNLEYFDFSFGANKVFDKKKCFQSIAHFSELKKLSFRFYGQMSYLPDEDHETQLLQISNLMPLKSCTKLLSLELEVYGMDYKVLKGIHLIVPQLRQLSFENGYKLTDTALESIAKLKSLTHFQSGFSHRSYEYKAVLTADGVKKLINGCRRLKQFLNYDRFQVTDEEKKTFEDLIEMNPNIDLIFKFILNVDLKLI